MGKLYARGVLFSTVLILAACGPSEGDGAGPGDPNDPGTSTGGVGDGDGANGGSGDGGAAAGGSSSEGTGGGTFGGAAGDGDSGGSTGGGGPGATGGGSASEEFKLPEENAGFDYQIGGAYEPPQGVTVVSRDRNDSPAPGIYSICYVNGFQVQPDEEAFWEGEHPNLILRDEQGDPVIDPDWDEMLLDTSTLEKRMALATIVGGFIEQCAADGFDAVEVDNLDTYSRSGGRLTQDNNVAFMALLSDIAHENGLASGQKNSAEILSRAGEMSTDFAVSEECNRYDECADYQEVYGNLVFVIEYREQDFTQGCVDFPELSIVLRDLEVSPFGEPGYVRDGC